ncbi:caspase domain-containing protein [Mycena epipterygia]|nr:caspase domain-containing protein [Mycena epipterygia]
MVPLEEFEKALWAQFNMVGEIDSDELMKTCQKQRLLYPTELERLDRLHRLRLKKYQLIVDLKLPNGAVPRLDNTINSTSQTSFLGSRFWAVIIGVNNYDDPDTANLTGCVSDALLQYEYLTSDLGVPSSNIKLLVDHHFSGPELPPLTVRSARRIDIIDALYTHLRDNPNIHKGDNVLIHFSGHGSSYQIEFGGRLGGAGSIEAICPSDRGTSTGRGMVADISDREINEFLRHLRATRSPNITVILDCCHSGGATRSLGFEKDGSHPTPRPAYALENPDQNMLVEMLQKVPSYLARPSVLSDEWTADWSSHVLMAACNDIERAYEDSVWHADGLCTSKGAHRHGLFTYALISALRSPEGRSATYYDLIKKVLTPLQNQTPIVVGPRRKSLVWHQDGGASDARVMPK